MSLWQGLTGIETLALLGRVHGRVDEAYRDELIERFALDPSKKVRAYSKGNRQKVSLVAALMTRAEILILDEPTSGLDPLMEKVFRDCVLEARINGDWPQPSRWRAPWGRCCWSGGRQAERSVTRVTGWTS